MTTHRYFVLTLLMSIVYWILDSGIHWLIYSEELNFFPTEANELWMRSLIITLLCSLGFYADYKTKQLLQKEQEKTQVFKATVQSTQHILNNLLNQVLCIQVQLEEKDLLDKDIEQQIKNILHTGTEQVHALSEVKNVSEQSIKQSIAPEVKPK
ncbi:MAG: hypothetical protein OEY52_11925 [Gammaproteobacteria bacterium]|nr:hypothetical protein [Gammaproteobacteria bacterium]